MFISLKYIFIFAEIRLNKVKRANLRKVASSKFQNIIFEVQK